MDSTAIVIPNWNGIDEVGASIKSLRNQTMAVTVIVVDNGSVDGSREMIEKDFPDVVLLPQPKNLGFAGGVNKGITYALEHDFQYIGLFNSDAAANPEWAETLVKTLIDEPGAGIATGLLLHGDGKTIDSTGDWYSIWGLPFPRGRGKLTESADKAGPVFSGSGGASIYRASLFKKIELFDETFFAYYEDVDISFRAQLAGFTVAYEPAAIAFHERGSASVRMGATRQTSETKVSGFTIYQTFKNLPLLYLKNVPSGLLTKIGVRFYCAYFLILANAIKNGYGASALKGLGKSLMLLPHALRERTRIQDSKSVSANYIQSILWPDLPPDQTGLRKFRRIFTRKG